MLILHMRTCDRWLLLTPLCQRMQALLPQRTQALHRDWHAAYFGPGRLALARMTIKLTGRAGRAAERWAFSPTQGRDPSPEARVGPPRLHHAACTLKQHAANTGSHRTCMQKRPLHYQYHACKLPRSRLGTPQPPHEWAPARHAARSHPGDTRPVPSGYRRRRYAECTQQPSPHAYCTRAGTRKPERT